MPVKKKTLGFWAILAALSSLATVLLFLIPESGDWLRKSAMPWLGDHPKLLSAIFVVLGLTIGYLFSLWRTEHAWAIALREEVMRRPTTEESEEIAKKLSDAEVQLAELKRQSHVDDQMYLDRMNGDKECWTWLENFNGWYWRRERLLELRDLWHQYKRWEFRDTELEQARQRFLNSVDTFFRRVTDERSDAEELPYYDSEGEILYWESHIRRERERTGGPTEYEAVKEELGELAANILSDWSSLLAIARTRPGLSVKA